MLQDAKDRRAAVEDAADLLKRLAHPGRLAIACRLVESETTVAELEEELGLRQPSLSQQLAELRNAGIIAPRRSGKTVRYRLTDDRVLPILAALHGVFCRDGAAPAGGDHPRPAPRARTREPVGAAVFARVGRGTDAAPAGPHADRS